MIKTLEEFIAYMDNWKKQGQFTSPKDVLYKEQLLGELMAGTGLRRDAAVRFLVAIIKRQEEQPALPGMKLDIIEEEPLRRKRITIKEAFEKKEKEPFFVKFTPEAIFKLVMRSIMILVIPLAVFMAIAYNVISLTATMGLVKAWVASIVIVFFGILCAESFVLFLIKKNNATGDTGETSSKGIKNILGKPVALFFLLIMWLIVFTLSMSNILKGQYDKHSSSLYEKQLKNKDVTTLKEFSEEEQEFKKEYDYNIAERDRITYELKILDTVDNTNDLRKVRELKRTIIILNKNISDYMLKLNKARENKQKLRDTAKVTEEVQEDFYTFLSRILFKSKMDPGLLHFLHIVLPALVLDTIASVSIALLFILKDII